MTLGDGSLWKTGRRRKKPASVLRAHCGIQVGLCPGAGEAPPDPGLQASCSPAHHRALDGPLLPHVGRAKPPGKKQAESWDRPTVSSSCGSQTSGNGIQQHTLFLLEQLLEFSGKSFSTKFLGIRC
ncbi:hypothetical protein H1C71_026896 [Ictidomys tridecemlineatus]|nr:hypothetical protein H1C71_026896 [Ictidomys tridecemlineatus]